jgi:hypothetical protein
MRMRGVTWSSTVAGISVLSTLPPHSSLAPLASASSISALQCSTVPMPTTLPSTQGSGLRGSPSGRALALLDEALRRSRRPSSAIDDDALGAHADLATVGEGAEGAPLTAASTSASSSTTSGALPPSSSTTGFRYLAQVIAMSLPTRCCR